MELGRMRWEEWRAIEEVIEGGGGELWRDGEMECRA
jgi:hypothetical protein